MNDTLKQIGETGIVPVVVLNKADDAGPLAQALVAGGAGTEERGRRHRQLRQGFGYRR